MAERKKIISGIQQIGIGVPDVHVAWKWYRKYFGVDVRVFEESAEAKLMLPYTGGEPQSRHAALAINIQGGGGFEIWQYTKRIPQPSKFQVQLGDLGLFAAKIKSKNVKQTYDRYRQMGTPLLPLQKDPAGTDTFFVQDLHGNPFQVVHSHSWFAEDKKDTGAVYGAIIGVSDIEKARVVYSDILGYNEVVYDKEGKFNDFAGLPGGENNFRRVLLTHSDPRKGSFSKLFGKTYIELVQVKDRNPVKIFENRFWGDLGFIHLCFDVSGMEVLREECKAQGHPFTVDSEANLGNSFDMGEAAGHFSYIEDPDGTLIEFVETHKVPVFKKLGLYLNLKKRNPEKALPDWMVKALALGRIKDK